jgi:hypothetical protein
MVRPWRPAAEFRDHRPVLALHRHVVDSGAPGALALDRMRGEPVAALRRLEITDAAMLRHHALIA